MIARIFICIPYARRKSHKSKTSESGGVQAENVRTAAVKRHLEETYMEMHIIQPEDS